MPKEAVLVLKVIGMNDEKHRVKAMTAASGICGINYISVNMNVSMLTAKGDFDTFQLANKLMSKNFTVKMERFGFTDGKNCSNQTQANGGDQMNPGGGSSKDKKGGGRGTSEEMVIIVKLNMHDETGRQKAMKAASGICGINCIFVDMNVSMLTAKGDFDPIQLVKKLTSNNFTVKMEGFGRTDGKNCSNQTVSGIPGAVATMKDAKLTVKGEFDPMNVSEKQKNINIKIEMVKPAKDEKKKVSGNDGNMKGDRNPKDGRGKDPEGRRNGRG